MTHFYHGYAKTAGSDTSLIAIGNGTAAAMTSAGVENLHKLIVKRFYDRFGEHFYPSFGTMMSLLSRRTSPKVISTVVMPRHARSHRRMRNARRGRIRRQCLDNLSSRSLGTPIRTCTHGVECVLMLGITRRLSSARRISPQDGFNFRIRGRSSAYRARRGLRDGFKSHRGEFTWRRSSPHPT